jgi:hypothetical protein
MARLLLLAFIAALSSAASAQEQTPSTVGMAPAAVRNDPAARGANEPKAMQKAGRRATGDRPNEAVRSADPDPVLTTSNRALVKSHSTYSGERATGMRTVMQEIE